MKLKTFLDRYWNENGRASIMLPGLFDEPPRPCSTRLRAAIRELALVVLEECPETRASAEELRRELERSGGVPPANIPPLGGESVATDLWIDVDTGARSLLAWSFLPSRGEPTADPARPVPGARRHRSGPASSSASSATRSGTGPATPGNRDTSLPSPDSTRTATANPTQK